MSIEMIAMICLGSCAFLASAVIVGFSLELWIRNAKRWRLIMDAYAEGIRDAKKMMRERETSE